MNLFYRREFKSPWTISFSDFGNKTSFTFLKPLNASSLILSIPSGTITISISLPLINSFPSEEIMPDTVSRGSLDVCECVSSFLTSFPCEILFSAFSVKTVPQDKQILDEKVLYRKIPSPK